MCVPELAFDWERVRLAEPPRASFVFKIAVDFRKNVFLDIPHVLENSLILSLLEVCQIYYEI